MKEDKIKLLEEEKNRKITSAQDELELLINEPLSLPIEPLTPTE